MLALVTAISVAERDPDLPLLLDAMPEATVVAWDDPSVDWSGFASVVIRSTWNYPLHIDAFRNWARSVAEVATLWNPLDVVLWNTDKRYLLELAADGIPTVSTSVVEPGVAPGDRGDIDWAADLVVKPAVGADARGVVRTRGDVAMAHRAVAETHRNGLAAIVQPYQDGIDEHGETCLVYLGGVFSHAVRKQPVLASPDGVEADPVDGVRTDLCVPSDEERALGERALAGLPDLAYARVDLLPSDDGWLVSELELIEPSIYLRQDAASPARAAAAFRALAS